MSEDDTLSPLRIRPGARFTCHGDGLCCEDVHAFGPVTADEERVLAAIDPAVVTDLRDDRVLATGADGRCIFRRSGRCELHAALGPQIKPASCRQFPYLFVATPTGGRVATDHRCPCRTMGAREALTPERALAEGGGGAPDRRITATLPLTAEREVTLPDWERVEAPILRRLMEGDDPIDVLDAEPLADVEAWRGLGTALVSEAGADRFSAALRCFGAAVLRATGAVVTDVDEQLPWALAFDRAEARTVDPVEPAAQIADWVADRIWSLEWAFVGTFDQARAELATRVVVTRQIAAALVAGGTRPDRATAEAIAVAELAALTDEMADVVATL